MSDSFVTGNILDHCRFWIQLMLGSLCQDNTRIYGREEMVQRNRAIGNGSKVG